MVMSPFDIVWPLGGKKGHFNFAKKGHYYFALTKSDIDFATVNNSHYPAELSVTRVQFEAEDQAHYVAIFRDISFRSRFEAQLVDVANHDPLTGLFNRRAFETEMTRVLSDHKNRNRNFAVIWLDLDRFKAINDEYGHQACLLYTSPSPRD